MKLFLSILPFFIVLVVPQTAHSSAINAETPSIRRIKKRFAEKRSSNRLQGENLIRQLLCYLRRPWDAERYLYISYRYARYGCWCGQGNTGGRTVDNIDKCCKGHDKCYDAATRAARKTTLERLKTRYPFECANGASTCTGSGFGRNLCECDKIFAACIRPVNRKWKATNLVPLTCKKIKIKFPFGK